MNLNNIIGKDIFSKTRDYVIEREFSILKGRQNGKVNDSLNELIKGFSGGQIEALKKLIIDSIDATLHELCLNFDENNVFKIVAFKNNELTNMHDQHNENLVGLLLDSIDEYSNYNTVYDIVVAGKTINKSNK